MGSYVPIVYSPRDELEISITQVSILFVAVDRGNTDFEAVRVYVALDRL